MNVNAVQAPPATQPEVTITLSDVMTVVKVLAVIAIGLTLITGVVMFVGVTVLDRLGYTTMVVSSGSMEPDIMTGAVIFIDPSHDVEQTAIGDVLTFTEFSSSHSTTHRVIGVSTIDGVTHFQTQGDANATPDPNLVPADAVYGKVITDIPYIGFVLHFSTTPGGKVVLFGLPAIALMLRELKKIVREVRKAMKEAAENDTTDTLTAPVGGIA